MVHIKKVFKKQKNKVRGSGLPDFKTSYVDTVVKIMWYLCGTDILNNDIEQRIQKQAHTNLSNSFLTKVHKQFN